jgi:tRNA (guanine-N7-)-methyltransferase
MTLRNQSPFEDRLSHLNADKNVFVKKFQDNELAPKFHAAHGPMLKEFQGKYREKFASFYNRPENKKLVVEIGCHLGKTLRSLAQNHNDIDFVGMDITFKRVVTTAERTAAAELKNTFSVMANAKQLTDLFGKHEVDGFLVFFPDPWPKKKQAKNRLVEEAFCESLKTVLKPGGFIWLKTDQKPYFDNAEAAFTKSGFKKITTPAGILTEEYETTFETRYKEQNLPTYSSQWFLPQAENDFFSWENSDTLHS